MTDETNLTPEDIARMWESGDPADLDAIRAKAESRIADWLYEHRDDPDLWADEPGVVVEPRRLGSSVAVTFSPDEMDAIRRAIGAAGGTLTEFIHSAVAYAAWKRTRPIPPHTCGLVGCDWCDPFGRAVPVNYSTVS